MTGGLMNLTAAGNENIVIHGNPKKTFFKAVFKKHTNFGLQRFRTVPYTHLTLPTIYSV